MYSDRRLVVSDSGDQTLGSINRVPRMFPNQRRLRTISEQAMEQAYRVAIKQKLTELSMQYVDGLEDLLVALVDRIVQREQDYLARSGRTPQAQERFAHFLDDITNDTVQLLREIFRQGSTQMARIALEEIFAREENRNWLQRLIRG